MKYIAPPTVARMMRSDAFARVVKGPVGSGKTSGCVKELSRRAGLQRPWHGVRRTRFAVIRNTYRELRDTTRKTFEQWMPGLPEAWRESDFAFDLHGPGTDGTSIESEILFRSLDRPEDIRKLLSLELTGAYINEVREIPKAAVDVLETRIGRYPRRAEGGPTWFGWWGDTNPWHGQHWGAKLFRRGLDGYELYEQPSGLAEDGENLENLPPGYYDRLCVGKDQEWIDIYVKGLDASAAPGSVYGRLIEALRKRRGVGPFDHPADGVFTSWDLGYSDSTAIWFWRINENRRPDLIDHYEAHGREMTHYFEEVEHRGYTYAKHWLPHDAKAKTLATGSSILDQALKRWPGKVAIGPQLSVSDGIAAGRWLLEKEQDLRVHSRCVEALETLAAYRYDWDDESQTFGLKPVHDFASHTADAFRYLALVVKFSEIITRKQPPPAQPVIPGHDHTWTLDRLFADNEEHKGRRRI